MKKSTIFCALLAIVFGVQLISASNNTIAPTVNQASDSIAATL